MCIRNAHSDMSYNAVDFEFKVNESYARMYTHTQYTHTHTHTVPINRNTHLEKVCIDWLKKYCDQNIETSPLIPPRNNSSICKTSVFAVTLLNITTVNKKNGLYRALSCGSKILSIC